MGAVHGSSAVVPRLAGMAVDCDRGCGEDDMLSALADLEPEAAA